MKPLSGTRVLDLTNLPPGGFASVILADLGAEVIRIEPPAQRGKPSLVIGQVALSRAKRSVTLDMRQPGGIEILRQLVATADVVLENAKPGTMEARGFGYSHADAANPRIVWCALTGFGQTGPYANHAAHDLSFLAQSGVLDALTMELPWQPALPLALQAGALAAVIGIQSALLQRVTTGLGAFLDISLAEAAGWLLTCGINPLSATPFKLPASADRRLYACADGRFVAVASAEPRTWQALCDGLRLDALKDALHKPDRAAEATEALAAAFISRPAADWVNLLAPAGAAVTIVNAGAQVRDDPQVVARGSVMRCGDETFPASPIRMTVGGQVIPATDASPPHMVGDDTDDVLAAIGLTADAIADLRDRAII